MKIEQNKIRVRKNNLHFNRQKEVRKSEKAKKVRQSKNKEDER